MSPPPEVVDLEEIANVKRTKRKERAGPQSDSVVIDLLDAPEPANTSYAKPVTLDLTEAVTAEEAVAVVRSKAARTEATVDAAAAASTATGAAQAASAASGPKPTENQDSGADQARRAMLEVPANAFFAAVTAFIDGGKNKKAAPTKATPQSTAPTAAGAPKVGSWASGTGYGGDRNAAKQLSKAVATAQNNEAKLDANMLTECKALIQALSAGGPAPGDASCALLRPCVVALRELMRNDSLLDVSRRADLYLSLAELCSTLAKHARVVALLGDKLPTWASAVEAASAAKGAGGKKEELADSLLNVLKAMHQQATTFQRCTSASTSGAAAPGAKVTTRGSTPTKTGPGGKKLTKKEMGAQMAKRMQDEEVEKEEKVTMALASALIKAYEDVSKACEENGAVAVDKVKAGHANRYIKALTPHRFDSCDLLPRHYFREEAKAAQKHSLQNLKARNQRVAREISSLSNSLPVEADSSILTRVDNDRPDVLKVLIFPSLDTPYALGAFEFDVYLPPEFPSKPPKVQFLTTGGNSVRFNPNLYETGKVCLSLLGTWEGPGWDEAHSTLLQVLISIQSLIFVERPYFNEPGWERSQGTPEGERASAAYNARVRLNTLKVAILPHLKAYAQGNKGAMESAPSAPLPGGKGKKSSTAPPSPSVFSEAIRVHFQRKARDLTEIMQRWLEEEEVRKDSPRDAMYCGYLGSHASGFKGKRLFDDLSYTAQEVRDALWKMM